MNNSCVSNQHDSSSGGFRLLLGFLMVLLLHSQVYPNEDLVKWKTLTTEDGLSQNSVYAILQDRDGFMWFGTRLGLNRYDGKAFRIFNHNPSDSNSLPGYRVTSLCEDQGGILWIGTKDGGLAKYDKLLENFTPYSNDPEDITSLPSDFVTALFKDSREYVWIGTDVGLCRYSKSLDSFERIRLSQKHRRNASEERISAMAEMPKGTLWIGLDDGSLYKLNLDDLSTEIVIKVDISNQPRSSRISSLVADRPRGVLWVGQFGQTILRLDPATNEMHGLGWEQSRGKGVVGGVMTMTIDRSGDLWIGSAMAVTRYDPDSEYFQVFDPDPDDPDAIHDNMIYSSFVDPQGNVWMGTESMGVSKYAPGLIRFGHVTVDNPPNSILAQAIFSIEQDRHGRIWFGTLGGGLSSLDPATGEYQQFMSDESRDAWSRNYPCKILPMADHTTWFSTFYSGLYHMNFETGAFDHYPHNPNDPTSPSDRTAYALLMTRDSTLWVGGETQGLDRFDETTRTFHHYQFDPEDPNSISSNYIYALLEDQDGYIWAGTFDKGLNRFDPKAEVFERYYASPGGEFSLNSNNILSLYEDSDKNLWVGTRGGGLNRIAPDRETITQLDLGPDLEIVNIFGILQDQKEYLWLSTNHGIIKAHPDSGLVHIYTTGDGTQSEYYFGSCLEASDGTMYFGGIEGYNVFHPDSIQHNDHIPPIVLTGLSINYERLRTGEFVNGRPLLNRSITYSEKLELGYRDKVIQFTFAALDFANSRNNQYAYKLQGYDKNWIKAGTNNSAQYMNLPAGNYTFRVRGTNNDRVWNEDGVSLEITVLPPFWKTLWFRSLLSITLLAFVLIYARLRTAKMRAQQVMLEKLVRDRTEQLRLEMEDRQRLEIEQTQMKADHLRRELLTQSLYLNDKQQIMEALSEELESVSRVKPDDLRSRLKKLQRFLKDKISLKESWEEFEHWFSQVHTGFYAALREHYPKLSESELKVCALLRLKMSSKDIARVMNIQPPSVDIYRHRIRKKVDLPSAENLSSFLSHF